MSTLDSRALRSAFGTFMTGVTIVTTRQADGTPLGFTANSFTSVSLEPPLILVCIANTSDNLEAFVNAPCLAVNVLAETQMDLSNTFARPAVDRFAGIDWVVGPSGAPVLPDVAAWFDCTLHRTVEAGDHVILIAEVQAFADSPQPGLGYVRGSYVQPSMANEALDSRADLAVSALIERHDSLLFLRNGDGTLALPRVKVGKLGVVAALQTLLDRVGLNVQPGFVYSVFEDLKRQQQQIVFLAQASDGEPRSGQFIPIAEIDTQGISDRADAAMLERFIAEHAVGNYGVYVGDDSRGSVRRLQPGGSS